MSPSCRFSVLVLLCCVTCDGVSGWYDHGIRRNDDRPRSFSYPRDWDIDWSHRQRQHHARSRPHRGRRYGVWSTEEPDTYDYQEDSSTTSPVSPLRPRVIVHSSSPKQEDTRGVMFFRQRGSATIPYPGATVHVRPDKTSSAKFYKGTITTTITDGVPKKKPHRNQKKRNRGSRYQHWEAASQDEPVRSHKKVCARCPSDRAVLAKRGSTTVLMEPPPIIPCHPWSSVEKVRSEVVIGTQPGDEMPEGSHKIVIQLKHRRRVLATCVTRYNVIVRKCEELELGVGVRSDCPLGRAWGARCNLTCDLGYDLEGDSYTECTDDLEWSGTMPQCVPTTACPKPVSPDNGHLSCRTPHHQPVHPRDLLPDGSVCHFLCDPGYAVPPAQQHLVHARCVAGSWDNDQDPVCVETNELEEEDPRQEISVENAIRFDGEGCPENYCQNGGKCIMILEDPMCSCKTGFSGHHCEEALLDPDPDESNTVT